MENDLHKEVWIETIRQLRIKGVRLESTIAYITYSIVVGGPEHNYIMTFLPKEGTIRLTDLIHTLTISLCDNNYINTIIHTVKHGIK